MSDAPQKKRCPNCAWAMGLADTLQLPPEESWILTVIAERVDPDMRLHATMVELSRFTRLKPVTLSKHLRSLAAREVGITMVRSRDGYQYTLDRPKDAHSKPTVRGSSIDWPDVPVADPELQNLHIPSGSGIANPDIQELQNLTVSGDLSDPGIAKSDDQDAQNSHIPILSPLKHPLKEGEGSLRSPSPARARGHENKSASPTPRKPDPERWAEFCALYPAVPGGRPWSARLAYEQALTEATAEEIIEGLRRYSFRSDPDYVLHPANWLRERGWTAKPVNNTDLALAAAGLTEEDVRQFNASKSAPPLVAIAGGRS